jgi:hypothetical protein
MMWADGGKSSMAGGGLLQLPDCPKRQINALARSFVLASRTSFADRELSCGMMPI